MKHLSVFGLIAISSYAMAQVPAAKPEVTSPWASSSPPPASSVPDQLVFQTPSPASAATPAPVASEVPATPSYFRLDHDYAFGLQLWAGATHSLGNGIGIATDIIVAEGQLPAYNGATASWFGEFDIGPAFTFGPLTLTPMTGVGFDWAAKHVMLSNEQLYTFLNTDKIYAESWLWALMYTPFKENPSPNVFHTRDWILYKLSGTIAIGPQIEIWANMKSATLNGIYFKNGITSMPIGGHVDIAYGTGNTLGLFLGYETSKDGRDMRNGNATVGRFTFVHNF